MNDHDIVSIIAQGERARFKVSSLVSGCAADTFPNPSEPRFVPVQSEAHRVKVGLRVR